jgi:phosphoesterase RecJ-like protein
MNKLQQAGKRLVGAKHILIISHIRPDGDAIGSTLGLGLALQASGKSVQMVLADGVPKEFHFLTASEEIKHKPEGNFDVIVSVDCSGLDRVGDVLEDLPAPTVNIDHHISNLNFAEIDLVDHQAAATAEMLATYLPQWGLTIDKPVAEALLTGLITDTIGFRTPNVSPTTMRTAANLIEAGADISDLYQKALIDRSYASVRYWRQGLQSLEMEDGLVWVSLTLEDRQKADYPGNGDADLINLLSSIEEADIAVTFIEQEGEDTKVSWRAKPGLDVSEVAAQFGGGGHKLAAGATIRESLGDVRERVLEKTRALLKTQE